MESQDQNTQDFLDYAIQNKFGDIHFKVDPKTGMKAIIAIHNTKLGPALGGCRFIEYPSLKHAITDAMRLARGMSYKAASVNLPLGGGKGVIIKPRHNFDRTAYLSSFAKFVNELGGRYITAVDSGTDLNDMDLIMQHTPYVASAHTHGDPSPYTAFGVLKGIEAAVAFKLNKYDLNGIHVAIQGLGHVGFLLAKLLHERGARLTVSDIDTIIVNKAKELFGATVVSTKEIHKTHCDVFAPCALGGILNERTIPELKCLITAGAANNQLEKKTDGMALHKNGILYAPDFIINAGGLIYAANKYLKSPEDAYKEALDHIGNSLTDIFARSRNSEFSTSDIADKIAQEKLGEN